MVQLILIKCSPDAQKLPAARPTAVELLGHPFLAAHPPGSASLADLMRDPAAAPAAAQPDAKRSAAHPSTSPPLEAAPKAARQSGALPPTRRTLQV